MEIYTLLDHDGVRSLRSAFEEYAQGIDLQNFVISFLLHLPKLDLPEEELVRRLISLFSQADANDDGAVEWQEFTQFCIDMGVAATESSRAPCTVRYVPRNGQILPASLRKCRVSLMYSLACFNKLLLCEAQTEWIHVVDVSVHVGFLHSFEIKREEAFDGTLTCTALAFAAFEPLKLLVVAATDSTLRFLECSAYDLEDVAPPREVWTQSTGEVQRSVCFARHLNCLVTSSHSSSFHVWLLKLLPAFSITKIQTVSDTHEGGLSTILALSPCSVLVSGGQDGLLKLWRKPQGKEEIVLFGTREFHRKPIRRLCDDGKKMVLSAGFEMDVAAWDVSSPSLQPIFQLRGHAVPLGSVAVMHHAGRAYAVSGDVKGGMRLWDAQDTDLGGRERCAQRWTVCGGNEVSGLAVMRSGRFVAALADEEVVVFEAEEQVGHEGGEGLLCAVVNRKALTVVCALRKELKLVSSISGEIVSHFRGVAHAEITAVCVDAGGKRIVVADQGGRLSVVNHLNGALMKEAQIQPKCEISHMIFCSEDKLIITASWDRALRIWDERPPDCLLLLRVVFQAVEEDVSAMDYQRDLGILAVAAEDASLRLWDSQFLSCIGGIGVQEHVVTALRFYAKLLFAIDVSRRCSVFKMMPEGQVQALYACLIPAVPSCVELTPDYLFLGDDSGWLSVVDIEKSIGPGVHNAAKTATAGSQLINPYRKSKRCLDSTSKVEMLAEASTQGLSSAVITRQWKAHSGEVRSLEIMGAGGSIRLLTSSADDKVRLWTKKGSLLGSVWAGQQLGSVSSRSSCNWEMAVAADRNDRDVAELIHARELIRAIRKVTPGDHEDLCELLKEAREAERQRELESRRIREVKMAQLASAIEDARKTRNANAEEQQDGDILRSIVKGQARDVKAFRRGAALDQLGRSRNFDRRRHATHLKVRLDRPVDKNGLYPNLTAVLQKQRSGNDTNLQPSATEKAPMSELLSKPYKKFLDSGIDGKLHRKHLEKLPSAGKGGAITPEWRRFANVVRRELDEGEKVPYKIPSDSEESAKLAERFASYAPNGVERNLREALKEVQSVLEEKRMDVAKFASGWGYSPDVGFKEIDMEGYSKEGHQARRRGLDKMKYFGGHSRTEVSHVAHVLKSLDLNNDGIIDLEEFTHHMEHKQMQGTFREIIDRSTDIFRKYDKDNAGALAIEEMAEIIFTQADSTQLQYIREFIRTIKPSLRAPWAPSTRANLFRIYSTYDLEQRGSVCRELARNAAHAALYQSQSVEYIDNLPWSEQVTFEEFVQLCTNGNKDVIIC